MRTLQTVFRNYRLILLVCIMVMSGCDNEETQPSFYSIDVASDYHMATEEWLFATDSEGNVLAVIPVSGVNITIPLEGDIGSRSTFTLHHIKLVFGPNNPFLSVNAESYTEVPVGGTWRLAPAFFSNGTGVPASVTINDFQGYIDPTRLPTTWVSSILGDETMSRTVSGNTADIEFAARNGGKFVVSSLYNNSFYYSILDNVTQSTHHAVTLKPMDPAFVVEFSEGQQLTVELAGYLSGEDMTLPGYINSQVQLFEPTTPITMGYIDEFDKYRSSILTYAANGGAIKNYEKYGARLVQLPDFEEPVLSISSERITSFVGEITIPYHYAMLTFLGESPQVSLGWTVWRNGNGEMALDYKLPALPEVISSRFPSIEPDHARFTGGYFVQAKDDYRYTDMLSELSEGKNRMRVSTEYFSYRMFYW